MTVRQLAKGQLVGQNVMWSPAALSKVANNEPRPKGVGELCIFVLKI